MIAEKAFMSIHPLHLTAAPSRLSGTARLKGAAAGELGALAEETVTPIDPEEFADQVYAASKAAFSDLISANASQSFYAFGLWTDDSLQFLHPAANTEEALIATVRRYRETVDPRYGCTSTRSGMRWSYGDWGFFPYEGGDHFGEINRLLHLNFDRMVADDEFDGGLESLWDSILDGFGRLELEGFFGKGSARSKITLLLVGDLPSELIYAWASALNPKDVADQYLNWNCDAADEDRE
jgi:hypothetical protein